METVWTEAMMPGNTVTMATGYGPGERRRQIASKTAVWSHAGTPVVPMRWVRIRDPERRLAPPAVLPTHRRLSPVPVLPAVVRRGQRAAPWDEARAHRGVATPRQWRANATARTTPAWLALSSLVTWMAAQLIGTPPMPVRTAAW